MIDEVAKGAHVAVITAADCRRFTTRVYVGGGKPTSFTELDLARIAPPDDDEY